MVESRQPEALALTCLFPVLASIFVIARTFSRYLGQNFGWDDALIFASLFLLLGETLCVYEYILLSHTGYHIYDIPKQTPHQQVVAAQWSFAVQIFYHPMMTAIRASIIMFLFRVKDPRSYIRIALHFAFWINICYMIATTLVTLIQCTPVHYSWTKSLGGHGKCINSLAFILASCALSIAMDLIIIPIPTAMVWNLQMRKKTKIAVVIIMSMGWIATAVSVARFIVYYYRFGPHQHDKPWDIGLVISIVEPAVGIMAACTPAMKCLFRHLMPRYFSDSDSGYPSDPRSRARSGHKKSLSLRYTMNKEIGQDREERLGRQEEVYGMKPLGSIDSREQSPGKIHPGRTQSVKTGHSATVEAVPKHFLSHPE